MRKMRITLLALTALVMGAVGAVVLSPTARVLAQNTACYMAQGGATWTAGTGCTFAIGTGATFTLDAVEVTATGTELNLMDGVTSTTAELNILDGVTSTAAELNILDGVTSTAAELNILDGVTSTAAELNILDGVTATAAELNASSDQSTWAALNPAADDALTLAEHGIVSKTILMSSADGDTFTLPAAAGTGATYTVIVATTRTSNNHIIQVANATDEFLGIVWQIDADTSDAIAAYPALDADGFDTITMDGSTKGGIKGDRYEFTDVAAGHWNLKGFQTGTGSVASPLSAAVS